MNIAYFTPDVIVEPKDATPYEFVEAPKSTVSYAAMADQVIAKCDTALKLEPSADDEVEAVAVLRKDELVQRIAVGSNGWSMVEYNGEVFYALTADLETVKQ